MNPILLFHVRAVPGDRGTDLFAVLLALTVGLLTPAMSRADEPKQSNAFRAELSARVERAEKGGQSAVEGTDGWLFFVPELRTLSVGPFWGEHARKVSRSSNPDYADPLVAIVDFKDQLDKAGIELLVVPVPAKAAIYPDKVSALGKESAAGIDTSHQQFYQMLKERGVSVLDLTPRLLDQRKEPGPPLFCKTDTHWSGRAIGLAAQAIEERVRERPWLKDVPKNHYESDRRDIEITGDLARMIDEANPARETVPLTFVGLRRGKELVPVETKRESPVLLMGDSHTLVFHDPDLFARALGYPTISPCDLVFRWIWSVFVARVPRRPASNCSAGETTSRARSWLSGASRAGSSRRVSRVGGRCR